MLRIIGFRVLSVVPVLLGISVISFLMIRLIPGDVVTSIMGEQFGDPDVERRLRRYFGLDQPVYRQFATWFGGLLQGDLGTSMRSGRPVTREIFDRFPSTAALAFAALFVSLVISIPLGVISATRRNGAVDAGARVASLVGLSVPNFWFGILLVHLFSVKLGWLPSVGSEGLGLTWTNLRFMILPAFTLGASLAAVTMRMTRSSMLEVLGEDYIRAAYAKGLSHRAVITRHALRNSLIPVVTVVGIQAGALLGGTIVVEQVFSWPGLGSLVIRGINQRDYVLVQGTILFLAVFYVIVNLAVDILYAFLDPRLRHAD